MTQENIYRKTFYSERLWADKNVVLNNLLYRELPTKYEALKNYHANKIVRYMIDTALCQPVPSVKGGKTIVIDLAGTKCISQGKLAEILNTTENIIRKSEAILKKNIIVSVRYQEGFYRKRYFAFFQFKYGINRNLYIWLNK